MELVDIKVKKSAKGDYIDGKFYVKELDYDEFLNIRKNSGKHKDGEKSDIADSEEGNMRLIQACLVDEDGEHVFKPQQINLIKKRMSGVNIMATLIVATNVNDISKLGDLAEKYAKN